MDPLTLSTNLLAPSPLLGFISLSGLVSLVYVALGLGLVIFFHELGHFAVAKWCNVKVERFSLGFGPILWRFKKGETEYALSAIPFGGYVKMLGQDDMDPSQLTQDEIALDPRSFSAKSVPQRMAIISAGVIMNVITGLGFFAIAFGLGVEQLPPIIGGTEVGYPAWEADIREGDTITRIGTRKINSFLDIRRAVALSATDELKVQGTRADGETRFEVMLVPLSPRNTPGLTRRLVGVGLMMSPKLFDDIHVLPGSPAAAKVQEIPAGGTVVKANGADVADYTALQVIAVRDRERDLALQFETETEDGTKVAKVTLPPRPFRETGIKFEVGRIAAIRKDSPAAKAELKPGDKITHVIFADGETLAVGNEVDPFRLPDLIADHAGENVGIRFTREVDGKGREEDTKFLFPEPIAGWTETPSQPDAPLSIPAIGLAFHILPRVLSAEGPARGLVDQGARLVTWELLPGKNADGEIIKDGADEELELKFDEGQSVAYAFWLTQQLPARSLRLTFAGAGADAAPKVVKLEPTEADDWFVPDLRGLRFYPITREVVADDVGDALGMAFSHTRNSIEDIYLTLRNLFTNNLSPTELHGPVGIAKVAYQIAHEGISPLLLFLGFLSMNLAVLNFLPIPLLDGGHMVFLIWEGVTRRKPSEGVLVAATYVGMAFVLGLLGFVLYLDLFVHKG